MTLVDDVSPPPEHHSLCSLRLCCKHKRAPHLISSGWMKRRQTSFTLIPRNEKIRIPAKKRHFWAFRGGNPAAEPGGCADAVAGWQGVKTPCCSVLIMFRVRLRSEVSVGSVGVISVSDTPFSEGHAGWSGRQRLRRCHLFLPPTTRGQCGEDGSMLHDGALWRQHCRNIKKKSKIKNLAGFLLQISMSAGAAEAETSNKS